MTEPFPSPLPTQPVPAPLNAPTRAPWALVAAGLAGLAVGALVVGGAWLASGSGAAKDTRAINVPSKVGKYIMFDQVELNKSPGAASNVSRVRSENEQSSRRLSQSFGGTAAVVRVYSDQELQQQLTLMIYRARSPHPQYVRYEDTQALGLARPYESEEEFGEVSCVVQNDLTPVGTTPIPESIHVISCSRTGSALTVEIRPNSVLGHQPAEVAKLVDEVWSSVS